MKKLVFIVELILSIFLIGCDSCNKDCESVYLQFDLPLQVEGIKDTLHFGDSLLVKFAIPDKLPERRLGDVYDFIDYNFLLKTYVEKVDTSPVISETNSYFDWENIKGTTKYGGGTHFIYPIYENNNYYFEVLIRPKEKGLYVFGMNCTQSRFNPLKDVTGGPCSKNSVSVFMKLENDTNTNFEFLQHSPDPVYVNLNRQRFDEFAGFCFYVK